MAYRNGNYAAFYVDEPFSENNLGAHSTPDFRYYNQLRMWKGADSSFPYNDSHQKNYNVRDNSDWEKTLKPRIRERLRNSKNIVLFLSSITRNSRALREEMNYGIGDQGLPVVVIYPDFSAESDIINCQAKTIRQQVKDLWDKLPSFRDGRSYVPVIHVPLKKSLIRSALGNSGFTVQSPKAVDDYFYPC